MNTIELTSKYTENKHTKKHKENTNYANKYTSPEEYTSPAVCTEKRNVLSLLDTTITVGECSVSFCYHRCLSHNPKKKDPNMKKKRPLIASIKERRHYIKQIVKKINFDKLYHKTHITLTWAPKLHNGKRSIDKARTYFLKQCQLFIPDLKYIYFKQLHRSGRPHYHLILSTTNKENDITKNPIKKRIRAEWYKNFKEGDKRRTCYIQKVDDIHTLIKGYLLKPTDKDNEPTDIGKGRGSRTLGKSKNMPQIEIIKRKIATDTAFHLFDALMAMELVSEKSGGVALKRNGRPLTRTLYFLPQNRNKIIKLLEEIVKDDILRKKEHPIPNMVIDYMTIQTYYGHLNKKQDDDDKEKLKYV